MASIDVLWSRIIACSGEVFGQQRGRSFTYSVSGNTVYVDTANQDQSRRQITEAYNRMPWAGRCGWLGRLNFRVSRSVSSRRVGTTPFHEACRGSLRRYRSCLNIQLPFAIDNLSQQ